MALQQELEREGNWLFRYRSYLPIAMLAVGMMIFYVTLQHHEGLFFRIQVLDTKLRLGMGEHGSWRLYEYLCLMVSLLGVAIRIYTVGHTPANTSGRNTTGQLADNLNTTGIYSLVRHPLYLGNFHMYFGIAMLVCDIGFAFIFILTYWLYYERIMYCEEQFLHRKFGEEYTVWASHTPAFIPRLSHFKRPDYCFSWKKVVKKEKNGIFALFLIFTIFDGIAVKCRGILEVEPHGFPEFELGGLEGINPILLVLTIVSGIAYVVLKIIKKKTHLLDEEGR